MTADPQGHDLDARRLTSVAVLGAASVLALDPGGWFPFSIVKWWTVLVVVLVSAAVWCRSMSLRPTVPMVALAALVALVAVSGGAGLDPHHALLGIPVRHLGVVAWASFLVVHLVGAAIATPTTPASNSSWSGHPSADLESVGGAITSSDANAVGMLPLTGATSPPVRQRFAGSRLLTVESRPSAPGASHAVHTPPLRCDKRWSYGQTTMTTRLTATPDSCFWGYLDASEQPVMSVDPGETVTIEAITHHAGDAPDLLMDEGVRAIWYGIAPESRAPGVHIMTGPIEVRGAKPGDTLRVELLSMSPRVPYGSNCAAHWGLFHQKFGKERITIYELLDPALNDAGGPTFPEFATPIFGFDFTALELYDVPGVISEPDPSTRQPFGRDVWVPVRPHLGVMGVAPEGGRVSSIPPGAFGGNVDNWRFGPGATVHYPVFHEGAGFYVGDPHFAQGDGEICGTAIEASLDVTLRLSLASDLPVEAPLLRTDTHWYTHGFSGGVEEGVDGLGNAMRMAAEQMLKLMVDIGGFTMDEAYSLASVAVDMGVTQVVDGIVGCHAGIAHSIIDR